VDAEYHLGDHRRADHRAARQVGRPRRQAIPIWLTILLGIVGALIGNWLAALFGVRFTSGIDWIRHILQVGAAAVLIAIVAPMWLRRGARRGV
jgi:uncharacterized membrane protein YeaQ/YmgE (transglycosylase-associated protein family)